MSRVLNRASISSSLAGGGRGGGRVGGWVWVGASVWAREGGAGGWAAGREQRRAGRQPAGAARLRRNSQMRPYCTCFHAMSYLKVRGGGARGACQWWGGVGGAADAQPPPPPPPPLSPMWATHPLTPTHIHPPLMHPQLVDDVSHHNVVLRHQLQQHLISGGGGGGGEQGGGGGCVWRCARRGRRAGWKSRPPPHPSLLPKPLPPPPPNTHTCLLILPRLWVSCISRFIAQKVSSVRSTWDE